MHEYAAPMRLYCPKYLFSFMGSVLVNIRGAFRVQESDCFVSRVWSGHNVDNSVWMVLSIGGINVMVDISR